MAEAQIKEDERSLRLSSPLGPHQLLPTVVHGQEGLSELFRYRVEVASPNLKIEPKDLLGKNVTLRMARRLRMPRLVNGIVRHFAAGAILRRDYRVYWLEIVPALWLLTQTSDCRIFQDQSSIDIAKSLFGDAGLSDYEINVSGKVPIRPYCVQYRETDFDFLSRLFEEDGIHYYFRHEEGKHILVLGNRNTSFMDCPETNVRHRQIAKENVEVFDWRPGFSFHPGKWVESDYNFETPSQDLTAKVSTVVGVKAFSPFEVFDYPGRYPDKNEGAASVKLAAEATEARFSVAEGQSDYPSFMPGAKFAFTGHEDEAEQNVPQLIVRVEHHASDETHFAGGTPPDYANSFTTMPFAMPYRPEHRTPKPRVGGPQTAFVVGPAGEEIFTDKYGRVKVQFHWDRLGKKDERSSCWLRCIQPWSGKQWGDIVLPRIGMEVVVDFIDGDVDRPMVIGSVYNAEAMPPYSLPGNKTQSGRKSRSTLGGGEANFNELRFEDKIGSEQVYFHAEKDMERIVENDDTLTVGNNQTETIQKGNRKCTIEMGNDSLTLKMGNQSTKLDLGKSTHEAMQSIELIVGQSSVKVDQMGVTIKGMMININGQVMTDIKGLMTNVQGTAMLILKGGITMIN